MITIIEVAIVLSFYAVGYGCNRMITRACCDTPHAQRFRKKTRKI